MNGAVWYRFQAELRRSWRSHLLAALVLALVIGGALASFAGARRTASAMPRLVEQTATGDVLVNPDHGVYSQITPGRLAALPEVADVGVAWGMFVAIQLPEGAPDFSDDSPLTLAAAHGLGSRIERPVVTAGTALDPTDPDQVFLSQGAADRYGVAVGDTLPALIALLPEIEEWEAAGAEGEMPMHPLDLTVAGIGYFADQVQIEDGFSFDRVTLTEAFYEQHPDSVAFWGGAVRLAEGVRRAEFEAAVAALAPGEAVAFQWTDTTLERFQTAVRPQALALGAFGAVLLVTGLFGIGLVLTRHADANAGERRLAAAMGMPRRSLLALGGLHGVVIALMASTGAAGFAFALSHYTPVGPARRAEPDPGVQLDLTVTALGTSALVLAVMAMALLSTRLADHRASRTGRISRPSRLADAAARLGLGPSAVVGTRMATERGAGSTQVPVRMTLAGAVVAVMAVVGAATFTASLNRVVETPSLYGSNWDATAYVSPPDAEVDEESVAGDEFDRRTDELVTQKLSDLNRLPEVAGVSVASFAQVAVGDESVPALGIDTEFGTAHPTLVEGRAPRTANEVVMGTRTMRDHGLTTGETVAIGGRDITVVGRAVFPGYAEYPGQDKTALGDGVWMSVDGLSAVGQLFAGRTLLIDLVDGADAAVLREAFPPDLASDDSLNFSRFRPAEVDTLQRVRATPSMLAVVLGGLGVVAVAYVLVAAIRRRRQLLGILRVLGFTGRQVTATLLWNAAIVAGIAVLLGIPLGVVLGRWSWTAVIDQLGGHAAAVVPWAMALAAVGITFATTVAASILPARRAATIQPAVAMRAE